MVKAQIGSFRAQERQCTTHPQSEIRQSCSKHSRHCLTSVTTQRPKASGHRTTLRYENQLIVAEGDYVIAHGRFRGMGRPAAWIAADVIRFEGGLLKEHWDVLQDEATKAESVSGLPMFGDTFPK
jgi:predicted SnoaL-like aldol condensation-catalyzing enzyme